MARAGVKAMLHDRVQLIATTCGVVFAVILSTQQLGILYGLFHKNTMLIDHGNADIWMMPRGTQLVQRGAVLPESALSQARSTPGVLVAEPLVFGPGSVARPDGGTEQVILVGTALPTSLGGPWNIVAGDPDALNEPDTLTFEVAQRVKLGNLNIGSVREVNGRRVRVGAFTWGLVPFGPAYSFAEIGLARDLTSTRPGRFHFVLMKVEEGADVDAVATELQARVPEVQVWTAQQYHDVVVKALLAQQLGITFGSSAALGLFVGLVIVALSMFSSVVDHQRELGTLKAIGCRTQDLAVMLCAQAVMYGLLGSLVGLALAARLTAFMRSPNLAVMLPINIIVSVPFVMTAICLVSATLALNRIRKLEPGMVFR